MFHEKPRPKVRPWLMAVLAAVILAACIVLPARRLSADMNDQAAVALRQTVVQAAVQCYAVEGVYPPSLEYLEDNYGLQINRRDFIVSYSVFATNQMPEITVLRKNT